jgi:hypothetical protein
VTSLNGDLAARYADHLVDPGTATAEHLVASLTEAQLTHAAELLAGFARNSDSPVSVPWWDRAARCHVCLTLPTDVRPGDLWFDPLEVTVSLAVWDEVQGVGQPSGWMSLDPVTAWHVQGAHEVRPEIPVSDASITGGQAIAFCALFSKTPPGLMDWLQLKQTAGIATARRLWGEPAQQYGEGGSVSGTIEVLTPLDLDRWKLHGDWFPNTTSELTPLGIPFRTMASTDLGLWQGHGALSRTWRN